MADSPNKTTGAVVRCSVYSEGNAVGAAFQLVSVHLEKAVNRIGRAELLYEAGDMATSTVPESDDDTFAVGKKIRIEAGYDDDESPVFEGIVVSHGLEIGRGNEGLLRIECRDYAFPLTMGRRSRVFTDSTDSSAIQAVAGEYPSLSVQVDSTSAKHGELVQYYSSDWDFILSLADRNGLVVLTEGEKMTVKKPAVGEAPVLSLTYGPDIIAFQAEVSAGEQIAALGASAWDPSAQDVMTGEGGDPDLNSQGSDKAPALAEAVGAGGWDLQTACAPDTDALTGWADAHRLRAGMARIQGSITCVGSAKAVAGCLLELDGFGKHFNGQAYAGAVEHEIREGNWETTVHLGIPAEMMTEKRGVTAPAASGLLPGIGGLHIATVTKLNEDPAQNGRIQVDVHTFHGKQNLVWARLASAWAANGYGSFLIPDVGDEVVVGFFNNDPCYPVVLGSLYGSARKAPYELTAENYTRALVTKEGMKVVFDEEKKTVTLETPGNNKMILSDENKGITLADQNGNKLVMNDSGITLESAKDLTLKAKMNLKAEAGTAASIQAKTDLKLKGMNMEAKADVQMTVKGTATAEFSASGQTTIKGAMVMIN